MPVKGRYARAAGDRSVLSPLTLENQLIVELFDAEEEAVAHLKNTYEEERR